jgi:GTP-binding protein
VKFIDEALITVQSGDGGAGCVSFRRERFVPKGGPDGGDGGKGGDVIVVASEGKRNLYHFRNITHFRAQKGSGGQGSLRTGKGGKDLVLEVPPGTLISDAETARVVADLTHDGDCVIVAQGGRGGQGNKRFATSTHRTPRFAQPGEAGQTLRLKFDLKLIADVGIIGLPNAGKSTLISRISSARPKIGDYPFTTLSPNLGVVTAGPGDAFVVADIPGLIEGAHQGAGLGTRFLRHIERTRILVHLIDASGIDAADPMRAFRTINAELRLHSATLALKPQVVVLTKLDLPDAATAAAAFQAAFSGPSPLEISAATGQGLDVLLAHITRLLDASNEQQPPHSNL